MGRPNEAVGALLQEYADLISITGGQAFKTRVYEKAARAVGGYPADVSTLDLEGLEQIPNVGKSIAEKIAEYLDTGRIQAVERLRAKVPAGVLELTPHPNAGTQEGDGPLRRPRRHLHRGAATRSSPASSKAIAVSAPGRPRTSCTASTCSNAAKREDRGEIRAAHAGQLPDLVTATHIRGDLHTHTDLTDGLSSLEDMVAAARARGYEYYAVTDHAKNLPMQRVTDDKMLAQRNRLRTLAADGP